MNTFNESLPIVEAEEIIIRSETMEKSVETLQEEEGELHRTVQELGQALEHAKNDNPADFALFKQLNGKLRASKNLLEEVRVALAIKMRKGVAVESNDAFTKGVEGEYGGALKKMDRRAGK